MNKKELRRVLGRDEYNSLATLISNLSKERILLTGAEGSLGTRLVERLSKENVKFLATDILGEHEYLDNTDFKNVFSVVNKYRPTIIVNIAGAKHAPLGEKETWKTLSVNTLGTKNLIDCAPPNCKVILLSTCKANNAEVVYVASKLIAERMTLNAGGSIVRCFNVVETSGNVFEIWNDVPEDIPIKVVEACSMYFISLDEAVGLIIYTMNAPQGRYIVNSTELRKMGDVAKDLYPDRKKIVINPRLGDRIDEKFMSTSETIESYHLDSSVVKIKSIHD